MIYSCLLQVQCRSHSTQYSSTGAVILPLYLSYLSWPKNNLTWPKNILTNLNLPQTAKMGLALRLSAFQGPSRWICGVLSHLQLLCSLTSLKLDYEIVIYKDVPSLKSPDPVTILCLPSFCWFIGYQKILKIFRDFHGLGKCTGASQLVVQGPHTLAKPVPGGICYIMHLGCEFTLIFFLGGLTILSLLSFWIEEHIRVMLTV